jgi:hypothetical protein
LITNSTTFRSGRHNPQKFLDFVREIKLGLNSTEALETAYGETVPQLQEKWLKWIAGAR